MDVMDEEAEAAGFMGAEAGDFDEESESDELLVMPLSQEEQLVRRLSEVNRFGTKIAVELDKENPCKGVVSRELLELELGALTRDRASIGRKLRLLSSEYQDERVDALTNGFDPDIDTPIPAEEGPHFNAPFSRRAMSRATEQEQEGDAYRRRCYRRRASVSETATSGNFDKSGASSVAFIESQGLGPTAQQSPFVALGWWEDESRASGASGAYGGSTMSTDSNDGSAGGLGVAVSPTVNEVSRFQHMTAGRPIQEDFGRYATEKTRRFWSPPPFAYGPPTASVAKTAPVGVVGGGGRSSGEVTPPSSPWMAPEWADDDMSSRQLGRSPELHCTSSRQSWGSDNHHRHQQQQQWTYASFSSAPERGSGGGGGSGGSGGVGVGYRRGTMITVAREPPPAVSYDRHIDKRSRCYSSPPGEGWIRPSHEGLNRASSWRERRCIADGGDNGPREWASHLPTSTLSSSDLNNTASHYSGDHCLTPQQEFSYPSPWGKSNADRHNNNNNNNNNTTNSSSARWGEGNGAHDDYESVRRNFGSFAPFSEPVSGPVSGSFPKRRSFRTTDQPEFSCADGWTGGWGGSEGMHYDVRRAAADTAPAAIAINALHEGVGGREFGYRGKHGREAEAKWGGRYRVGRYASPAGNGGGGGGLVEQMGRGGCDTPTTPTTTY